MMQEVKKLWWIYITMFSNKYEKLKKPTFKVN